MLTASGQRISGRDTLVYEEKKDRLVAVAEADYVRYENFVGMVVASKKFETDSEQDHSRPIPQDTNM